MSFGSTKNINNLDYPEQQRIWQAIDRLCKENPNVVKQLEKLADIKEKQPLTWKMGLKFLKIES